MKNKYVCHDGQQEQDAEFIAFLLTSDSCLLSVCALVR
jgi:hypothetical protein